MLRFAFYELVSYGLAAWLLFAAVTYLAARLGGCAGMLLGQIAVAIAVAAFDLAWIGSEMQQPGWEGQPDQDGVFWMGVVLRVVLVNAVLLPVGFLGLYRRSRVARGTGLEAIEIRQGV